MFRSTIVIGTETLAAGLSRWCVGIFLAFILSESFSNKGPKSIRSGLTNLRLHPHLGLPDWEESSRRILCAGYALQIVSYNTLQPHGLRDSNLLLFIAPCWPAESICDRPTGLEWFRYYFRQ